MVHPHEVKTVAWKGRMPPVYRAQCACSWKGPPRTGRGAQLLAAADGRNHVAASSLGETTSRLRAGDGSSDAPHPNDPAEADAAASEQLAKRSDVSSSQHHALPSLGRLL